MVYNRKVYWSKQGKGAGLSRAAKQFITKYRPKGVYKSMLKKGKKVLLLILAFALVLAMLAGCSGGWTGTQVKYDESNGGKGGTVSSNGG